MSLLRAGEPPEVRAVYAVRPPCVLPARSDTERLSEGLAEEGVTTLNNERSADGDQWAVGGLRGSAEWVPLSPR